MGDVARWYAGRSVLVTGGTGFMGKVLLEKLLRSCPDIGKVYILCRAKRGLTPKARLAEFSKLPVFERLRKECPAQLSRLHIIEGDILQANLGIKDSDLLMLQEEVSVVFNGAASLKLEAELKENVAANTRGTQRLLDIALKMKKLVAFIHFSTAFCHPDQKVLEEKLYPSPVSPHDIMRAMEWMDDETIKQLTPKILGPHPNSYTFTKRLTETLVDEYKTKLPVVIVRPSIVLPSFQEPVPGWVDSLNGPVGVLVASGKGVVRSMMCGAEFVFCRTSDFAIGHGHPVIPTNNSIRDFGIFTNNYAKFKGPRLNDLSTETQVFNISSNEVEAITWGEIISRGKQLIYQYPLEAGLWYPNGQIRSNRFWHYFFVIFTQILPAYLVDFIMVLIRQKTFLVRVQNRIWLGMHLLEYFTTRNWDFKNKRLLALHDNISEKDKQTFYIANIDVNIDDYLKTIILGARQYCLKEPLTTLPKARRQIKFLYVLDRIGHALILFLLGWLLMKSVFLLEYLLQNATQGNFKLPFTSSTSVFMKT
ncbi:putative fatty acyl-CoA reductase CG5065 [Diaphorina citri]|uniref:Fatty acyl-CoA reductase n=1 Tax=Diaphorina citri TaxID=121845 RepID=A0A3Q0JDS6_DIACI|nr:putative fatty acyl-CoA reductase CG5065 [Diaphorina citri]